VRHPGIHALLKLQTADAIFLDVPLIEKLDGMPVPPSSLNSPLGFSNGDSSLAKSWLSAGYKVWHVTNGIVEFRRL